MAVSNPAGAVTSKARHHLVTAMLVLAFVLGLLFFRSFLRAQVQFSNDGPYGAMVAQHTRVPAILTGYWQDLNWLGFQNPSISPTPSTALRLVTSPLGFSKWFCAFSLFVLGLGAWFCFRQWRFSPLACVLGALAAALSSHFFSTACWGVASQAIAVGMAFVAIGLVANGGGARSWVRLVLAGMAVGMGVMEGYDIGAIFSFYVAAFVLFQAWVTSDGPPARILLRGGLRVAVVAIFAGFLAAHAIIVLVGTQITGISGTEQTPEAKAARWDFATQWSMPKNELLRVVIPGLFGYRMDTPKNVEALPSWFEGGAYWGKVGETPGWSDHHNDPGWAEARGGGSPRFSGGGEYAGVLVVAVALWAVLQSLRKKDSVFTLLQRKFIWFWAGAAFISVLLEFGRYAPFYQFVYMLPYFSTIRNPAKFTHPFNWALVILFAYGIHGLCRRYVSKDPSPQPSPLLKGRGGRPGGQAASSSLSPSQGERAGERGPLRASVGVRGPSLLTHLKTWWPKANPFERKWVAGSVIAVAISLLGLLIYASCKPGLEQHLRNVGFPDPAMAAQIAGFSIREVGLFIVFLALTLGLLILVMSGRFTGPRARWGGILLGVLLVVDLSRANLPWIIYWNYKEKYATNPVIEFLRDKPYEHRVSILPFRPPQQLALLGEIYRIEWMQHHFQYYNIQSLDVIQMSREPVDYVAFEKGALAFDGTSNTLHHITRRWQLTNTRYLLGPAGYLDVLNQQIDPVQHRFQIAERFDIVPKPGETELRSYDQFMAVANTNGQYAVFSFNGALPRAKLYTDWQVSTNDQATLAQLTDANFDPAKKLLVSSPLSLAPSDGERGTAHSATNTLAPSDGERAGERGNTVDFVSYAPKRVVLDAKANAASVLLLNDRFDPNWKVTVDGKPETVLRCNYLMRGVQVLPGEHRIEFRFEPPIIGLYISLAAIVLGLGLIGFLALSKEEAPVAPEAAAPELKAKEPARA